MNISQLAVDRLLNINWFINIGKPTALEHVTQVANDKDFIKAITGDDWEDITLEARNEITGYLAKKHSNDYQNWNTCARDAQKIVDAEIIPLVKKAGIAENAVLDSIKWDLVSFLMEDVYKKHLKGKLFFESLIDVYENGHVPCGWEGEWPVGRLVIY
ncbi:Cytoplasmic protein [Kosakonia sp. BK9b]